MGLCFKGWQQQNRPRRFPSVLDDLILASDSLILFVVTVMHQSNSRSCALYLQSKWSHNYKRAACPYPRSTDSLGSHEKEYFGGYQSIELKLRSETTTTTSLPHRTTRIRNPWFSIPQFGESHEQYCCFSISYTNSCVSTIFFRPNLSWVICSGRPASIHHLVVFRYWAMTRHIMYRYTFYLRPVRLDLHHVTHVIRNQLTVLHWLTVLLCSFDAGK